MKKSLYIHDKLNTFLSVAKSPVSEIIRKNIFKIDEFIYNCVDLSIEEKKISFIPKKYLDLNMFIITGDTIRYTTNDMFYRAFRDVTTIDLNITNCYTERTWKRSTDIFKLIHEISGCELKELYGHPDLRFFLLQNVKTGQYIITYCNIKQRYIYIPLTPFVVDATPQFVKPGRFAKSLGFTDKESENFNNDVMAYIKRINNIEGLIEIIQGNDIAHFYHYNTYSKCESLLGNSCMRYDECVKYFDLYTQNPDVCQMVIIRNDKDHTKIDGRALLWTLNDGTMYMDRIYCISDIHNNILKDWGHRQNYKMFDKNIDKMEVELKSKSPDKYPFIDTFKEMTVFRKTGEEQKIILKSYYDRDLPRILPLSGFNGFQARLDRTSGSYSLRDYF